MRGELLLDLTAFVRALPAGAAAVVLAPADAGLSDHLAAPRAELRAVGVPWGVVHAGDRTRRVLWRGTKGTPKVARNVIHSFELNRLFSLTKCVSLNA